MDKKKLLLIAIPLLLLIAFQVIVAIGIFVDIDKSLQAWASRQEYNKEVLLIWSPYNVWLPVFLVCVVAWFTNNKKFIVLFLAFLALGTMWEIVSKQFIIQPAGVSSCMFEGCKGTLPSGHAFRSLFIVGAAIILSRWFIIFVPLALYTCYGLLVENWHWASDITAAFFLAVLCISIIYCFYQPRILGIINIDNRKYPS